MKVRKNLEAVFLVAAIITNFAAFATAQEPTARTGAAVAVSTAAASEMQVVVVKAKRLTPAEKAAL